MEAHHLAQIEGWRHELEAKQIQFEEARAQVMQPRELDKLRKQLLEELETLTREKLGHMNVKSKRVSRGTLKPYVTLKVSERSTTSKLR